MVSNFAKRGAVVGLVVAMSAAVSNGQIVINEIIQNPAAVSDSNGEWFELHNPTGAAIDIDAWIISDDGTNTHTIDPLNGTTVIPAGGYLVLGRSSDTLVNGGVTVDYVYGTAYTLSNGADEVVLTDDGATEIDRVNYDGGPLFPDPTGASMALDDPANDNNVGANWCTASTPYGDGDLGTPGAANDCAAITGACCTDGTVCADDIAESACQGGNQMFTAATACDALGTPCVPVNDECIDRIPLADGTFLFSNEGGNNSADEAGCTVGNDLYYNYVATCTGTATFSACAAQSSLAIGVYDGPTCPATTADLLGCDDNNNNNVDPLICGGLEGPMVEVPVIMGNTYKIRIGHWSNNVAFPNTTTAVVTVSCATPPVPTMSEWGFIVMCLLIACAGTVVFRGHRATSKQ
jgi:lamin tail-like protein